jgi:hypothetical protein
MTTFKEIRGQLIRSVSSDPDNPQVGQIWYNNTIGSLKGLQKNMMDQVGQLVEI